MKKSLLTLVTLCISILGYSQTFTDNFITYNVTSTSLNTVEITGYNTNGGTVVIIPETVTDNSITYTVTSISFGAFQSKNLTNVFIPGSVEVIDNQAFTSNNLTSITFSNGLTSIGGSAFRHNDITSITIPSSVTDIQFAAFRDNPLLVSVTSHALNPANVITGGLNDSFYIRSNIDLTIPAGTSAAYAAGGWTGFNSVTEASAAAVGDTFIVDYITYEVTSLVPNEVKTIDYNMAGGTVVNIPGTVDHNAVTYIVTAVGDFSFYEINLTFLTLSNSITSIGEEAFSENQISNNIVLPNNLTTLGIGAFNQNLLTSIVIPNSLTSIPLVAFRGNQLTTVTLPNNLISIGQRAFEDNQLSTVIIPNGVTNIGSEAFLQNQLTSIDIPDSVTAIGISAFKNNLLTSVILGNGLTSISELCFQNNQLSSISISDSVTNIEDGAFENNLLTNITLPANVSNIEGNAFIGNPLTSVTSENTTPPAVSTGSEDSFAIDRSNIHLHIPPGTTGAYVTDAGALWTGFNPVTEDALSIDDFELEDSIKVITNTDEIEIVFPSSVILKNHALYTITGAKVSNGSEAVISSASLTKGIYILKLDFNRGSISKKVVIH